MKPRRGSAAVAPVGERRRAASAAGGASLAPAARRFAQARARATYEALLAAAREVFAEAGFDAVQTPDIAARAAVSVGTFYRYFRDKRHAFIEMVGQHLAEAHAHVAAQLTLERFRDADSRAVIDHALAVVFEHVSRFPALERVYLAVALRDDEVAGMRARYEALGEQMIAGLIEALIPREVVPDPRAAARVIQIATVEVALSEAGLRGPRDRRLDTRAVRFALREMIHRFCFAEAPGAGTR